MSDERPVFARWRYPFAEIEGKKILIIEFFESYHWSIRPGTGVHPAPPKPPDYSEYWPGMYRLRINGRWYGPHKMSFFTIIQAADIVQQILKTGSTMHDVHCLSIIGWMVDGER